MTMDLTGDKPIKIRMVVAIMVIGVIASSAASSAITWYSLRRDVSDLQAGALKLSTADADEAKARQDEDKAIRSDVATARTKDVQDDAVFRSSIDTRMRAAEDTIRDHTADIQRLKQDLASVVSLLTALQNTINSNFSEMRETLAVLRTKLEAIGQASGTSLPGDMPPKRR